MTALRRHRPLSHPVIRRAFRSLMPSETFDTWLPGDIGDLTRFTDTPRSLPPLSATEQARITEQLDDLASRLRDVPDAPLTVQQRRLMRVIADELLRRSDVEPA